MPDPRILAPTDACKRTHFPRLSVNPSDVVGVRATVQSRQALRKLPTTLASRRFNQPASVLEELDGKCRVLKREHSWLMIWMSDLDSWGAGQAHFLLGSI
jgi:hypothetical protein